MSTQCKNCGTVFHAGEEPWLKQQEHCARHDVVYPPGTECFSCVAEREDAVNRIAADERLAAEGEQNAEVHSGSSDSASTGDKKSKRRNN